MSRPIRVLIADDERNLRELIVRELARRGHEADGVEDGQAALERLAEATYDVVVLDMKMPRKAGIEVLRELAGASEAPQVIVMTGFQDVATAVEAMKLGAYDYLVKPFDPTKLLEVIRSVASSDESFQVGLEFGQSSSHARIGRAARDDGEIFQHQYHAHSLSAGIFDTDLVGPVCTGPRGQVLDLDVQGAGCFRLARQGLFEGGLGEIFSGR